MTKLVVDSRGVVALSRTEAPVCKENEVVVAVEACGICGSDIFTLTTGRLNIEYWGHEVLGTVMFAGAATDPAWLGKRVVTRTSTPCGNCRYCQEGRHARCSGWRRHNYNGFSNFINLPVELLELVPPGAGEAAVLIEPLYVAMDLVAKAEVVPGDNVLIVGCGPIGLLALHLLARRAENPVWVSYRAGSERRRQIAEEWGAHLIRSDALDDLSPELKFDTVIVTAPYRVIPEYAGHVRRGGRIVYNGLSDHPIVSLDLRMLHTSGIPVIPSFPHPQLSFRSAGEYAAGHSRDLSKIISHRVPLRDAATVFELFRAHRQDVVKVVIDCAG